MAGFRHWGVVVGSVAAVDRVCGVVPLGRAPDTERLSVPLRTRGSGDGRSRSPALGGGAPAGCEYLPRGQAGRRRLPEASRAVCRPAQRSKSSSTSSVAGRDWQARTYPAASSSSSRAKFRSMRTSPETRNARQVPQTPPLQA